jgi:hypothetical protein
LDKHAAVAASVQSEDRVSKSCGESARLATSAATTSAAATTATATANTAAATTTAAAL